MKTKKVLLPPANSDCAYCEALERHNLDPARKEEGVFWHYETVAFCRDARRMRVRCQARG